MTPFAQISSPGRPPVNPLAGRRFGRPPLRLVPAASLRSAHEQGGFDLGWDHAHYGLSLLIPSGQEASALQEGLVAGQGTFGLRTLVPTRHVRQWLALRLHAWASGHSVEPVQVTPNYLQQIDVSHCPITRAELSVAAPAVVDEAALQAPAADGRRHGVPLERTIARVRNDAGYAAGNLAVMSAKANDAKSACGFREALACVQQIEAEALPGLDGLTVSQWARVAVLCSFVAPLPHFEAAALPMLVLPPNRLRLFNPVQALQAFVSQQLLTPGWARRISRFEGLLLAKTLQRDFKSFFMALLPRVLEGGRLYDARTAGWAIEDAWRAPLVQQRWAQFARQLDEAQCESLLARAAAQGLATRTVMPLSDASATDGWCLETRGYVAHRVSPLPMRQAQLC